MNHIHFFISNFDQTILPKVEDVLNIFMVQSCLVNWKKNIVNTKHINFSMSALISILLKKLDLENLIMKFPIKNMKQTFSLQYYKNYSQMFLLLLLAI